MSTDQPGSVDGRVDFDLLADYAGGALEGTPDQDRVASLVRDDPRWAAALDELRTADALVSADLAALGPVAPLPADVAARIQDALRSEAGAGDAVVVSLAERRRRRYRIAAAGAVAAGVLTFAGFGGVALLGGGGGTADTGGQAEGEKAAPSLAEAPGAESERSGDSRMRGYPVPVSASGTDYTRKNLSVVRNQRDAAAADAPLDAPPGLDRLAAPAELKSCLDLVGAAYPGTVTMADFARFEDAPAVVIAITGADGRTQVVVVGAECGRDGTDEKYRAGV